MKKFLINIAAFTSIGVFLLGLTVISYFVFDPFQVLYSYDSYFSNKEVIKLGKNKDFISTTTFVNNINRKKISYDSFLFGNSRSIFYETADWKKHIGGESKCYHFDANGEGLFAISKKIELIKKEGLRLKHVLLFLDYKTLTQTKPATGNHLFVMTPTLLNNENFFNFHITFLRTYLKPKFLMGYLDYKLFKKLRPYMLKGQIFEDNPVEYDVETNEVKFDYFEQLIASNQYYTPERMAVFYQRDSLETEHPAIIGPKQKNILQKIHKIFERDSTDYNIIIHPLYDQKKLSQEDINYLRQLFGENRVFDFSGINDITKDYNNYYEQSHYRPHIARKILDEIYQKQ
jgi:hypothetical protein